MSTSPAGSYSLLCLPWVSEMVVNFKIQSYFVTIAKYDLRFSGVSANAEKIVNA